MTQTHDVSGRRTKKKYSSRKRTVQPTLVTGTSQGTKRKRDDESGSLPADRQSRKRPDAKGEYLIEEIQALGGDATDIALVGDIESQSEQEGDQNNDPTLQADLELFAKGLSIGQSHSLDVSDSHRSELDLEVELTGSETRPSIPGLKTTFPVRPDWYNAIPGANQVLSTPGIAGQYQGAITSLKSHSRSIWEQEASRYVSAISSSSKHKFLSAITSTGTMSDKVSALTLAVQESPVHNAKALETLISMASKRNRGQTLVALSALVDLFGPGSLLPSDRRLRQFHLQPSLLRGLHEGQVRQWASPSCLPPGITEAHLLSWIFEDWLKEAYFRVLRILEGLCDDEVEHSRLKSLDFVFALLQEKPEQEANLLRLVIHKLGDPEKRIASRASYLLLQLMTSHPAMKEVIIKAVEEQIILRPSRNSRAMYYAITTLNQTILNTKDFHIADILHDVYFASFVSVLKTQQTQHKKEAHGSQTSDPGPSDNDTSTMEKLISAILTGVNRAAPFCSPDNLSIDSHIDTLFRVAHSSNFNTSIQALILIQQLTQMNGLARDRFYKTLYESLLDPRLITSSKQTLYLNLMFRSLKSDASLARMKAFVKRMIQVASLHQPPFICGVIYLVTELSRLFPALSVLFEEPEVDGPGGSGDADASTACSVSAHEPGPLVYDGRKRDPEYSNADQSCLWEVIPFNSHFHPSVALFAANLVSRPDAIQKPEFASHTLIHFLDRFVFRKARLKDSSRGASIMQPTTVVPGSGNLFTSQKGSRAQEVDINSTSFWQMKPADVPVEDAFFHEYFSLAGKQTPGSKAQINTLAETSDEGDESDIWNALASSHPGLESAEEDDYPSDTDDIRFSDSDDGIVDLEDMSSSNDDDVAGGSACDDDSDAGSEPVPAEPTVQLNVNTTMASTNLRKRKALKNLPMFAPVDDYVDILAMEEVLDNGL